MLHIADDGDWKMLRSSMRIVPVGISPAKQVTNAITYTHDGGRVVYTRLNMASFVAANAPPVHPVPNLSILGNGTVRSPRFLPDKRVAYIYQPATGAPRFIVQEPKADAERTNCHDWRVVFSTAR